MRDYCPFDECPRKKARIFICMRRFFASIKKYCPLFDYTEEERAEFFRDMERKEKRHTKDKDH
jgi:hypothetical protein